MLPKIDMASSCFIVQGLSSCKSPGQLWGSGAVLVLASVVASVIVSVGACVTACVAACVAVYLVDVFHRRASTVELQSGRR